MNKSNEQMVISALQEVGILKSVKRHGWLLKGIKNPESVADHTFRMAMIVLFLPKKYLIGVELSKVLRMILIHDLGEARIGDIKWESGSRVISSQAIKHADELEAVKHILNGLEDYQNLLSIWQEFNEQETAEAKLVKYIDKLEMLLQAYEYELAGYQREHLQEFWDNVEKYLRNTVLQPYLDHLKSTRVKRKK